MDFHRIYLLITVVLSGLVAARAQVALIMYMYNDLQGYTERYDVAEEL